MKRKAINTLLWAGLLVSVAITFASAGWVVSWMTGEAGIDPERIWRASLALVLAGTSGGVIASALAKGRETPSRS